MRSFGIADETQLVSLARILDDFCTEFGIANGDEEREEIGRRIMALFNCGYSLGADRTGAASGMGRGGIGRLTRLLSPQPREEATCPHRNCQSGRIGDPVESL